MSYEYNIETKGERLVVENLKEADYAYTSDIEEDLYEIRKAGRRLGRFDNLEDVEEYLENDDIIH